VRLYAAESMVYRTAGMIEASLAELNGAGTSLMRETQKRIGEYAVECSILKSTGQRCSHWWPTSWWLPWADTAM